MTKITAVMMMVLLCLYVTSVSVVVAIIMKVMGWLCRRYDVCVVIALEMIAVLVMVNKCMTGAKFNGDGFMAMLVQEW